MAATGKEAINIQQLNYLVESGKLGGGSKVTPKTLWEGEFATGEIYVPGLSDYSIIKVHCKAVAYMGAAKSTVTILATKTYLDDGATIATWMGTSALLTYGSSNSKPMLYGFSAGETADGKLTNLANENVMYQILQDSTYQSFIGAGVVVYKIEGVA